MEGLLREHLDNLMKYALAEKSFIVLRLAKQRSVAFIGNRGFVSKSPEVKLKTSKFYGLVIAPTPVGKDVTVKPYERGKKDWDNWKELERKKYTLDERGLLKTPNGKYVCSDYDIIGKYKFSEKFGWQYDDMVNTRNGLGQLNHAIVGHHFHHQQMFNHSGGEALLCTITKQTNLNLGVMKPSKVQATFT